MSILCRPLLSPSVTMRPLSVSITHNGTDCSIVAFHEQNLVDIEAPNQCSLVVLGQNANSGVARGDLPRA